MSGVLVLTCAMAGLAIAQYFMPPAFDNPPAVNQAGLAHVQSVIAAARVTPVETRTFVWMFRLLLASAWMAYATIVWTSYRHNVSLGRYSLPAIGGLAVFIALVFPPSLSSDVYAYVGWGRMVAIYGWSPYVHTLGELAALGDPAGVIAPVPASSTHGPVWIAVVSAIVFALRGTTLLAQVVAFKLLAALALVAAAISGRRIAASYDRQRAELTLLAIGFNPLFLIEGPGNGHNDVLMVALMLASIAVMEKGRSRVGFLLLGLSVGVKFITASLVPWLLIEQLSRGRHHRRLATAALMLGLVLAPSLAGTSCSVGEQTRSPGSRRYSSARSRQDVAVPADTGSSQPTATERIGMAAARRAAILILIYAVLSLALRRSTVPGMYLSYRALFSLTLIVIGAPVPFAWYMVWPLSASLLRWDRYGILVTAACVVMSAALLAQYTVLYMR